MSRKIFMASTHCFDSSVQVGSQHIARFFLGRGFRGGYMSAPVTPLHLLRFPFGESARRLGRSWAKPDVSNNPVEVVPFSLVAPDGRPILNSRLVTGYWHLSAIPPLGRTIASVGFDHAEILYLDNIFLWRVEKIVAHDYFIFRITDDHEQFPGWKGKTREMARYLADKADVVVYSALGLKQYAESLAPGKTYFLPNGVDMGLFEKNSGGSADGVSQGRPIVLYSGMIDQRIDSRLVKNVASALPQYDFVFVGPVGEGARLREMPDNVSLPGPVSHDRLPGLLSQASVGFIPFDTRRNRQRLSGVRPLKVLEYLAAGTPVVCSRWSEVQKMEAPISLYGSEQECIEAIVAAVQEPPSPDMGIAYAGEYDWNVLLERFSEHCGIF